MVSGNCGEAYRQLQRRQPAGVKPAFDPDLLRARFALLQRADHLNELDQARLAQLFDTHPRLRAGWDALQELYGLYLADDPPRSHPGPDRASPRVAHGSGQLCVTMYQALLQWLDWVGSSSL